MKGVRDHWKRRLLRTGSLVQDLKKAPDERNTPLYRQTLNLLRHPLGYVNGQNTYQFVDSSPTISLDPLGMAIEYVGVNPLGLPHDVHRDPVAVQSQEFIDRFVYSHRYGGTFALKPISLKQLGDVTVTGCGPFEATATYVPDGKLGSSTNSLYISDSERATLIEIGVDIEKVDAAISAVNARIDAHEQARADIWRSVYEGSYTLTGKGATAEAARADLEKVVEDLRLSLDKQQSDIYNQKKEGLRALDRAALDDLMNLLP